MHVESGSGVGAVPIYHIITPGDHYSPRTGSAVPTVVHGLATGAAQSGATRRYPQRVVIQEDTYHPRYDSADVVEYAGRPAPGRRGRLIDGVRGRLGLTRTAALDYFRPAADALRALPPGIVLAHNAPAVPWLLRGQPHAGILYAHNDVLRTFSHGESRRMLTGCAGIIAVSDSLAGQLRSHIPETSRRAVLTVRNGVDTEQFHPRAIARPDGPLRVMFVGRTIPEKGPDVLLDAAARLGRDDITYSIVGSYGFDPDAPLTAYEQHLRELAVGVRGEVEFAPFVDRSHLPELLRSADVLVVPSRWNEPLTLTVGEGLATGLVVLASSRGGIPEALGSAGILFDPSDPVRLTEALGRIADDPVYRSELASRARERAEKNDWRWAWQELESALARLVPAATAEN